MADEPGRPDDVQRRALSGRTQWFVVAAVSVVILIAIAAGTLVHRVFATPAENTSAAQAKDAPGTFRPTKGQFASLTIAPVKSLVFRTSRDTEGSIALNDDTTTPVFSPYSGRVTRLIAKLGDVVKSGGPLMSVDATEFVQAQNDLLSAVAALRTSQAQAQLAQANENRQHELFLAKAGAQKDWLQSQADLAAAQSSLRTAEVVLASVENRMRILGRSDVQIGALESAAPTQKMTAEAIVVAPIAGTVTQRQVGLGQYINSAANGATAPVYAISNLSSVWLIANVRETDAPLMRVGDPVEVRVPAYPGRVFKAKLAWVAPGVDPNTHRLPVRAEVENQDGALKPMMFATFSIMVGESVTAPGVPQSAVVYEGEEARVWVARDDGSVESRKIRVGRTQDDVVEVTQGLTAGEKIITSGALFIDRAAQVEQS
ncbi:MAG: efflux RND transporter periplasmic adaptor subunit [Burkholderiaceae bacterium]